MTVLIMILYHIIQSFLCVFNYYVINGEIVKRSFIAYMDDDEICIDEKYCTVLKIPKAYHGLDKLRDF